MSWPVRTRQGAPSIWAFGGGKGGVGKSLVCAGAAVELARRGQKVVVVDADLGAANLHTLLGLLHPTFTLADFFAQRGAELADFCIETGIPGLRLVSGAAAILRAAHPRPAEKRRLVDALARLDADAVLIDLGAGTHYNTLDFFNVVGHRLVVTSPEPTSIQNAYAFLKAAVFRRLELGLAGHDWVQGLLARAVQPRGAERIDSIDELVERLAARDAEVADQAQTLIDEMRPRLIINQAGPREQKRVLGALAVVCRR
ncbi:MAG: P-loop NTPase [Myxococcales bacterium]|nr:P-loop NTPase [Myxococcales bacterium]